MITLHHLQIGRSIFMVWALEEMGIEYDLIPYVRDPATMRAPQTLKKIHPLGKSPVIEDEGQVIAESGAIISYLLEKHDKTHRLHPPRSDLGVWAEFTQWLHYPEGSVFAPLLIKMLLMRSQQPHEVLTGFSEGEIALHLGHIQNQLGDRSYILSEQFSAADFGIAYVVSMAARLGLLESYPKLQAYLARVKARPAWQRAVARAIE
ncbi:MAG: glutathione S-transferase family protein [Pseudomonadales bacterium]|nr:glutathione S-transferase family protein [Pseudomonadales bacterium]